MGCACSATAPAEPALCEASLFRLHRQFVAASNTAQSTTPLSQHLSGHSAYLPSPSSRDAVSDKTAQPYLIFHMSTACWVASLEPPLPPPAADDEVDYSHFTLCCSHSDDASTAPPLSDEFLDA